MKLRKGWVALVAALSIPAIYSVAQVGPGPVGGTTVPGGSNFSIQYKASTTTLGGTGPGTTGQVLTSRGAGLSPTFQALPPSGSTFGADTLSTWTALTGDLSMGAQATPSVIHGKDGSGGGAGAQLTVRSGHGNSNDGGLMALVAGSGGGGGGAGGAISLQAGTGTANGAGGAVNIFAGSTQVTGTGPAAGGAVTINGGDTDQGTPGGITLNTGLSASGNRGTLLLRTGGTTRLTIAGTGATTLAGATTFNSNISVQGQSEFIGGLVTRQTTPATLSTTNNDYSFGGSGCCLTPVYRLEAASGGSTITGMTKTATDFYYVTFVNVSATDSITFTNEGGGSTAGNRILTPNAASYVLQPQAAAVFWYDNTGSARWRIIDVAAATGGVTQTTGTFEATWDNACTTTPSQTWNYVVTGQMVTLYMVDTVPNCTSDSTSFAAAAGTAPAAIRPASGFREFTGIPVTDNGTASANGCMSISSNGSMAMSRTTTSNCDATWTNSGNKGMGNGVNSFSYTLQ